MQATMLLIIYVYDTKLNDICSFNLSLKNKKNLATNFVHSNPSAGFLLVFLIQYNVITNN